MIQKAQTVNKKQEVCFLSGLVIPSGEYSIDHYVAKYWLPKRLYSLKQNLYPSIKIINAIKSIYMPCEWEDKKYDLCYYAKENWNLKRADKETVRKALYLFEINPNIINPCRHCILSTKAREYCYSRSELEGYRKRWLYKIHTRTQYSQK